MRANFLANIRNRLNRLVERVKGFRLPPRTNILSWMGDLVASLLAMLTVVFKRLRHNLGITISAIIGIIAVMGIVICVPVFSNAVSSKVLREQLFAKASESKRGLFSLHFYYLDKRSSSPLRMTNVEQFNEYIKQKITQDLGLRTSQIVVDVQSGNLAWVSDTPRGDKPTEPWMTMALHTSDVVRQNGEIIEGKWPEVTASGPIQVAILQKTAEDDYINVGDRFHYQGLEIEITGIWQSKTDAKSMSSWFEQPSTGYIDKLWVPVETYRTRLDTILERSIFYLSWYVVMDEKDVRFERAPDYAHGLVQLDGNLQRVLPGTQIDYSPLEALNAYQERADSLTNMFYAVSGPMLVLALLFISLTATIAVQQYEQEVATMRGRGTSWLQVASMNLIESFALLLAGLPLSLLFGWLAAVLMGQTLSFLRFTARSGVDINLLGINYLWLGISALLIVISRFLPVLNISRTTIVQVKQERSRALRKPIWQRFFLDFLLLIPGAYAYITLSGKAKPLKFISSITTSATTSGNTYRDPLLFVAPALFAMALCMIMLRLLPLLLRGLAYAVDNLPKVWAYLSLQQVARRPQDHSAALLLIMISLSMAIYSASTAKTLDKWMHDSVYYKSGADLVVHEYILVADASAVTGPGSPPSSKKEDLSVEGYYDVNEHLKLPAIHNVTRVGRYDGTFSYGVGEKPARFMGIDRKEFPQVAFYRDDFADQSLGALMNALAQDPMGVIVPKSMLKEIGLKVGDQLNADIAVIDQSTSLQLTIVGTYDYFPTVFPDQKPTLILNLESLFSDPEGVVGYDVWVGVRPNTNMELLRYQMRNMISPDRGVVEVQGNAFDDMEKTLEQPERVGLFGILNVGFIATGLMPGIGFVLYSYASLRRRFIQLGILQAIGLSVKQLIGYLALEQFLLMGIAIGCGAGIGLLTSNMFVPFLQISASGSIPIPPFQVLIGWTESAWLSIVFGLILFFTMLGTIWYLAHMKVFQAVKMGEAM
jgi:putative ABC transport system permease protein